MYVCRYTATTVSFRSTALFSWDLLVRHGNHSPCLLYRKAHLFCSSLFRIMDPRLFFNQSFKTPLTRVFWFFPTALIKPSSSQWIDHSTTVGSWRIASSFPCESWCKTGFFLNLFHSLCSEPRSCQFLILGPAGWSTPVGGNSR